MNLLLSQDGSVTYDYDSSKGTAFWFSDCDGKFIIDILSRVDGNRRVAVYDSVKEFKAAIRELGAAIKRGDEEFTFAGK